MQIAASPAQVRFTARAQGDLRITQPPEILQRRRSEVLGMPWTWLRQMHGSEVVKVATPGEHSGERADAAITGLPGAALAIHTADCAPVALVAAEGIVGAVHAGWRGVHSGVIEAAVEAMRAMGASEFEAVIGPCIHPECYEFGSDDLHQLVERYGSVAASTTAQGTDALDVPAVVTAALHKAGVDSVQDVDVCTACDARFFSHRARGDVGRQAMLVWLETDRPAASHDVA